MISFNKFQLDNGLRVIVHEDKSTPLAVMNILYNVGARDENPERTGFAHLFEHLMFGGSVNIPSFDEPLQKAGGENNAFTNNDITNYYDIVPSNNLETLFWLESDRMMSLAFNKKSLETQRKVVSEEFKEHYINQPYGDVWHLLNALAYKIHPYQWPTIGKELSHIENAKLDNVKEFFFRHYRPDNAIMVLAGNVKTNEVEGLAKKWFASIPSGNFPPRDLPREPMQTEARKKEVRAEVPIDAIYKAYHICNRMDKIFYAVDLLTDVLSAGKSSRIYQSLVKEKKLFSEVDVYQTGTMDEGLIVVDGKLIKGVKMETAEQAIEEELEKIKHELISPEELQKVKNKTESNWIFGETNVLNKAMNLAYFELLGDASWVNDEVGKYAHVTSSNIKEQANKIFISQNSSTLYYYSKR